MNSIIVYNESNPVPFDINDRNSAAEDHRLKYRYLELRTKELQKNMLIGHQAALATREFLSKKDFIEIETPILMKSTPEGARDFLVLADCIMVDSTHYHNLRRHINNY